MVPQDSIDGLRRVEQTRTGEGEGRDQAVKLSLVFQLRYVLGRSGQEPVYIFPWQLHGCLKTVVLRHSGCEPPDHSPWRTTFKPLSHAPSGDG